MSEKSALTTDQVIHHKTGTGYYAEVDSPPLSIKCMFNGGARYRVGRNREYVIDDSSYLILNAGTPYTILKSGDRPVETFCLFFPSWVLPSMVRDITGNGTTLLDDGGDGPGRPFGFYERRFPHGNAVTRRIQGLRHYSSTRSDNNQWLEEQVYLLVHEMLACHRGIERKISTLAPLKSSTRRELYRRMYWARDYMHANKGQPLSLAEMASVASLSPYHFLRTFHQLFNETPHACMTRLRVEKAKDLLRYSSLSVTEIAEEVGFKSLPSFIQLFRKQQHFTPLQYRRHRKKN